MRELLCETQSSKERLRRSRTESSGAAPAIEELAGGARQVRPAGPRADQYQPGSDFSRAKRSGGRPALRLPRATFSHRRSPCRLHTDYAPQKLEFPASALSSPIEEVWRAAGPPAPTTGKLTAAACISPPLPTTYHRSRKFPIRYRLLPSKRSGGRPALRLPRATFSHRRSPCSLHTDYALQKSEIPATVPSSPIRRGPEGDRPSGSHEHQNRAEVPHSAFLSTAHGSRKTKTAPFRNTGRGSRKNGKDYFSSRSAREEPETRSAGFFTAPE